MMPIMSDCSGVNGAMQMPVVAACRLNENTASHAVKVELGPKNSDTICAKYRKILVSESVCCDIK